MALTPGTRLGPYEIVAAIGAGGMGEVYRARDTKLHRDVALKVLPDSFANDPDRLPRFEREAQVLASLNHPNIAHIHGLEDSGSVRALVMELVDGEDLAQRITRGALPIDEALPIAKQVADALEAAHEQGIVHRDLKPANIKVRDDGTVKILDFGLAKLVEGPLQSADLSHSPTLTAMGTMQGAILGTAAYMSPEQARGRPVDKRTDVWAFGAVLYEILTGRRAFEGEDATEVIASVVKATPSWTVLPADLPPQISTLIQRCLEKDRKARIGDMAVARFLLSDAAVFAGGSAALAVAPLPPQRRGSRALPWAAAALALGAALAVSFIHFRETTPQERSVAFTVSAHANESIDQFRLSPDGTRLLWTERRRLWVRSLDSIRAVALGVENVNYPFWSADGTEIGFFSGGKLKKIPAAGGVAVTLTDAVNGRGGAWSKDGVIVFTPDAFSRLYRIPATGGSPVQITKIEVAGDSSDRFPEFLPDGQHFLFVRASSQQPRLSGLYVGNLADGSMTRVLPDVTNAVYISNDNREGVLLFRRDDTLIAQPFSTTTLQTSGDVIPVAEHVSIAGSLGNGAFTASPRGTIAYRTGVGLRQLVWVDRSGKELGTASKPDEIGRFALSSDDKAIAFGVGNVTAGYGEIWVQHLDTGVLSRFTVASGIKDSPLWSPDGSRLAFVSVDPTVAGEIYQASAAGAGTSEPLLNGARSSIALWDWSLDGKQIVFSTRAEKTQDDLWLLNVDEHKATPFLQTPAFEGSAHLSPDGRWLAYTSNESGGLQVYVQPLLSNGSKFQVSSNGGVRPEWSRDGKELFYLRNEEPRPLIAVPVTLGASFQHGQARTLWTLPNAIDYQRSADGQRFLVLKRVEDASGVAVTVITNWDGKTVESKK